MDFKEKTQMDFKQMDYKEIDYKEMIFKDETQIDFN